jgi:hypothetical protein
MLDTGISGTCTALATLLATILSRQFKFDNTLFGVVYSLILNIVEYTMSKIDVITDYLQYFHEINWLYLTFFGILIFLIHKLRPMVSTLDIFSRKEILITIYSSVQMEIVRKYIEYYPNYFNSLHDVNIGDKDLIMQHKVNDGIRFNGDNIIATTFSEDSQVHFTDLTLNVGGYYVWKKNIMMKKPLTDNQKIDNNNIPIENSVPLKYLEIHLTKLNSQIKNGETYIKILNEHVDKKEKEEINIKLVYTKIMLLKNQLQEHNIAFYNGTKDDLQNKEKIMIDTFFHQEKDRLWNLIKNIHFNPSKFTDLGQAARGNFLLYGPPGSGKSTFTYRIATCLNRHILSLDLREIKNKFDLYQIVQKPRGGNHKNYIVMLEEFDISIKEIDARSKIKIKRENAWLKYMASKCDNDDIELFQEKKSDVENKDNKKDKDTMSSEDGEYNIRDLLEIFQGPIPFDGMIMIATTNKFDEIKEICPELFRPGRLTPIYFGYINKDTLQEISLFYFNQKITSYIPENITIPTSQIIELALEAKSQNILPNAQFNFFTNKLNLVL